MSRTGSSNTTESERPSVSVIVPVHGDRGEVVDTLRALSVQEYEGEVEVIVVDNGDNPRLGESLSRFPEVTLIREPRPGSYAARNRGAGSARGAVLAFTDADCLPTPGWISAAVSALGDAEEPSFVGGAIELFPRLPSRPSLAELWDGANGLRQERYVREQGWAATANMITSRRTFDRVGAFDARLKSGGDREWGTRATRSGARPIFSAAAAVRHPARATMAELHRKIRRVVRGDVDARRLRGARLFDRGTVLSSLRPNTRSIVRRSRVITQAGPAGRLRYVLVAHWLQYYFFFSKVVLAVRAA